MSDCPAFCPNCCNYLYLQTTETEEDKTKYVLEKFCHNCGYVKICDTFFETSSTQISIDTTDLQHDLTFMRTRAIHCPKQCGGDEVLYLKKKPQEQHLLFVCCNCSHQFKHMAVDAADVMDQSGDGDGDGDVADDDETADEEDEEAADEEDEDEVDDDEEEKY